MFLYDYDAIVCVRLKMMATYEFPKKVLCFEWLELWFSVNLFVEWHMTPGHWEN